MLAVHGTMHVHTPPLTCTKHALRGFCCRPRCKMDRATSMRVGSLDLPMRFSICVRITEGLMSGCVSNNSLDRPDQQVPGLVAQQSRSSSIAPERTTPKPCTCGGGGAAAAQTPGARPHSSGCATNPAPGRRVAARWKLPADQHATSLLAD